MEDHFPHILANQKRVAEAYYSVILLQVNLLVDKMGLSAYLDLFSYGTDPQQFYAAASATTTLCDTNVIFFVEILFFSITALNAVPGNTLSPCAIHGMFTKALPWASSPHAYKLATPSPISWNGLLQGPAHRTSSSGLCRPCAYALKTKLNDN